MLMTSYHYSTVAADDKFSLLHSSTVESNIPPIDFFLSNNDLKVSHIIIIIIIIIKIESAVQDGERV